MTNPGARSAQQAYQQQVHHNNSANFHRNAAYQDQLRYRRQRGPVSAVGRFFRFVFTLVFLVTVIGIFLTILSAAQPDWFGHVKMWFDQIF